jgi:carboxyvinyl-carboxyphosphonate phosphorylmutase
VSGDLRDPPRLQSGGSSKGVPVTEVTQDNRGPRRLRELLAGSEPVVAPGAYDALSARLVAQAGFDAVYMTGFGASASLLGQPDVGLLSFAEMADQARRLAEAVDVPLIADADDGYGNPINVARTVRAYEAAGVAGLHLEDQLSPKRCGHLAGKQLVAASEMVEKVRAAVEARRSADLVIIARTDARAVEGLDAALERARCYRDAGADVLFVEAPESEAEVAAVAQAFPDTPLLFNAVEGGRTPLLELTRLRDLGFRLVLCPLTALLAGTAAVQQSLARLRDSGTPTDAGALSFTGFTDLIGLPETQRLEARFAAAPRS